MNLNCVGANTTIVALKKLGIAMPEQILLSDKCDLHIDSLGDIHERRSGCFCDVMFQNKLCLAYFELWLTHLR